MNSKCNSFKNYKIIHQIDDLLILRRNCFLITITLIILLKILTNIKLFNVILNIEIELL